MRCAFRTLLVALTLPAIGIESAAAAGAKDAFRPPAVPLVACDPYFSIWSCANRLTDDTTRHWTRTKQSLTSMIRIDGKTYRLMGDTPKDVPAMPQAGLRVLPTRTVYDFATSQVHVTLTFMTPALPDDLDVLARPVTYLTWHVRSGDGREHAVSVYFSSSAELAVNVPSQRVVWGREKVGKLLALRIGSQDQPVLQKKGDDLRIDWGYVYTATPREWATAAIAGDTACTRAFVTDGTLPARDDARMPRAVKDDLPVSAFVFGLGRVAAGAVSRYLMLAYDDEYSISYFHRRLRPYWRRHGAKAADLLRAAARDYQTLQRRCRTFDSELLADLSQAGGSKYALLAALAYRQCLAANKLVADANGQPLLFPKENFSNGCIATVDVIYPMDPFFLLFSPSLAKASLVPVLAYAASERWKFPFAPHDLGTYPLAHGQVYGGGERTEENQMPVEESGNMILLLAAIAREDGNADFAGRYWPQVTRWARYLEAKGFDPEKQLCTDDFAGHLAHNVNLSVKAIEALGAYALLCDMRGDKQAAKKYHRQALEMAGKWVKAADDGDHFRLAFDRHGTWSQKYNLVWDRILDLQLFPPEVARKEVAFYRKHLNRYGLPLDSRKGYAKLDWSIWTATLADTRDDFETLANPVYDFLKDSPSRVPMTDFYWTKEGTQVGFQARSVVGGVFIKMLADPALWKKWAGRDKSAVGDWAPLPKPSAARRAKDPDSVSVVPDIKAHTGGLYLGNRDPLRPSPLIKLPIGSIKPKGWLRYQLETEARGMTGRLPEVSEWCKFKGNAWSDPRGRGHSGWEELPYWLKGYGDLGYVLKDERIIKEARRWIDAVLAGQDADGWFGPRGLKKALDGKPDLWPNMLMLNVLQSYYEYTHDQRVLPFMTRYFKWQLSVPDRDFLAGYWPKMRAGDNLESVYWLYNRTGDKWLLDLAAKIHKAAANWTAGIPDWHGVNLSQGFREPAVYFVQARDRKFLRAAQRNYQTVMDTYGQFPGGGFAADETCRKGCTDPHQGFETCSWVEFLHSFEMLTKIAGDPVWADRCEEIAFNSLPAALTADQKALHYLTGANMVRLDKDNHAPGIQNGGTMLSYSPLAVYRCCQHNVSHGWPYYAEELWLATADKGLCASLYAASEVSAQVGDGTTVKITEDTDYPFGEMIHLKLSLRRPVRFPLYLRIPRWCRKPVIRVNGEAVAADAGSLAYVILDREWSDGDAVTLRLPMTLGVRTWKKNKNAVSVDYGPLTFSLKIGEKYVRYGGKKDWPELEVHPTTPWNYGLVLDGKDLAGSLELVRRDGPVPEQPFTPDAAPIQIKVKAKKIPGWTLDRTGLAGKLRPSPVRSDEPVETVTLIPMGAARLRITAFPTIGSGPGAHD